MPTAFIGVSVQTVKMASYPKQRRPGAQVSGARQQSISVPDATGLSLGRSVFDSADCSIFDRGIL